MAVIFKKTGSILVPMQICTSLILIAACVQNGFGLDESPLRGLLIRSPDFKQLLFIEESGNVVQSYFHGNGKDWFRTGEDINCAYLIKLDNGVLVVQSETNRGKSLRIERNNEIFPVVGLTKITLRKGDVEMCLFFVTSPDAIPKNALECSVYDLAYLVQLAGDNKIEMNPLPPADIINGGGAKGDTPP